MSRFSEYRHTIDDHVRDVTTAAYDCLPDASYTIEQRYDAAIQAVKNFRHLAREVQELVDFTTGEVEEWIGSADYDERREMADAVYDAINDRVIPFFERVAADLLEEMGHVEPYASESLSPRSQGVAAVGR